MSERPAAATAVGRAEVRDLLQEKQIRADNDCMARDETATAPSLMLASRAHRWRSRV